MIMKEICVYFITITRTLQHYFMCGIKCIAVRVFKASLNHFFNAENKEKITQIYKMIRIKLKVNISMLNKVHYRGQISIKYSLVSPIKLYFFVVFTCVTCR